MVNEVCLILLEAVDVGIVAYFINVNGLLKYGILFQFL